MQPPSKDLPAIDRLLAIMALLRGPDGCPWDREQTLDTLKRYAVEEVYEVVDAIDHGTPAQHCDELGDLLLQVVFQARLREEEGQFTFDDVVAAIVDKLIRRHPHVFGETAVAAGDAEEVVQRWEAIKADERPGADGSLASRIDGVPRSLPALMRARDLQVKAARVGFDWPDTEGAIDKLREEMAELEAAIDDASRDAADHVAEELGDVLFTVVNLARHVGVDPESALHHASAKFDRRFRYLEHLADEAGARLEDVSLERLESWWQRSKREKG